MSQPPTEPTPSRVSLHQLRLLVAGVCKDLMRARLVRHPAAFDPGWLEAWEIVTPPPCTEWEYLSLAAASLDRLYEEYPQEFLGSSLGHPDDEPPERRVMRLCLELVSWDGAERPAVGLRRVAGQIRDGTVIEWWTRCWWAGWPEVREQLYRLPEEEGPDRRRVHWDRVSGVLRLDGETILTLDNRAKKLRQILDRFQSTGWAYQVTLPGTRADGNRRVPWVEHAIRDLNKKQKRIRFSGDGSGNGVCHELLES